MPACCLIVQRSEGAIQFEGEESLSKLNEAREVETLKPARSLLFPSSPLGDGEGPGKLTLVDEEGR